MNTNLGDVFRLLWRGLFLEPDAYDEVADGDNPFVDGLFLVVITGLIIAVAAVLGDLLEWATTPDLTQIKELVLQGMQTMPWFDFMKAEPMALEMFNQYYDMGWQISEVLNPGPSSALANLILVPLGLIIAWLWFGLVAHGFARLLGGGGTLAQTLGAAGLAAAPALLNVFQIIPTIVVAAVGVWALLARYVALRRVHENLGWGSVLVAVLAPPVLLFFLVSLFLVLLIPVILVLAGGLLS